MLSDTVTCAGVILNLPVPDGKSPLNSIELLNKTLTTMASIIQSQVGSANTNMGNVLGMSGTVSLNLSNTGSGGLGLTGSVSSAISNIQTILGSTGSTTIYLSNTGSGGLGMTGSVSAAISNVQTILGTTGSVSGYLRKNNFEGTFTGIPGTATGITQGYGKGSLILNSTGALCLCKDPTAGAAVWVALAEAE